MLRKIKEEVNMREVTVSKSILLDKVKHNRKEHRDLFLKAQEGYRKAVIKELDQMLTDAKNNKPIRRGISLPEPIDHTQDYDRIIAMLEMSVEANITIDDNAFDQYVLDNWSWKQLAFSTNSSYANRQ
jgi:hypothetical protein